MAQQHKVIIPVADIARILTRRHLGRAETTRWLIEIFKVVLSAAGVDLNDVKFVGNYYYGLPDDGPEKIEAIMNWLKHREETMQK